MSPTNLGLAATDLFDTASQARIRRESIVHAGRMDPQVFDRAAVAPFALRISPTTLAIIGTLAENAWRELCEAESLLLRTPQVWRELGLPRRLQSLLTVHHQHAPHRSVRYVRFDFHPTTDGWRVSEINADVPGGLIEAGHVARIVARELAGVTLAPDPARVLAAAMHAACDGDDGTIALVHATSYSDDAQVMHCLQRELISLGRSATLASPIHLAIEGERAVLTTTGQQIAGIMRFFPAEWLANLPRRGSWADVLTRARIMTCNPLAAVLLQSKRLPIVLRKLGFTTPVWSAMTPRTRPLGTRILRSTIATDADVLKPAWGRVGSGVCIRGVTSSREARHATLHARISPRHWILQDRFTSVPVMVGQQPQHLCLGAYVINGRSAGIYARTASRPLIDGHAQDVAVVIDPSLDSPSSSREECDALHVQPR